jgi:outer membrane protein assembly factor BamE (lipoprotein component of BamABCDE complex)
MKISGFITSTRFSVFAVVCVAALSTAACASRLDTRGNLPDPERLAEIKPGEQTKEDVADILGSPSSITPFGSNTWYYISNRTETFAFFAPEVIDRHIVMVKFGADDKVTSVDTVGLEAGRKIQPVDRITPTHGNQITAFEQLIGNLGRFKKKGQTPTTSDPNLPDPY